MTDLGSADRDHLMRAVYAVESALRARLSPTKMNLATLGNVTPHLHWHVIPRFADDTHFPQPVWGRGSAMPKRARCLTTSCRRSPGISRRSSAPQSPADGRPSPMSNQYPPSPSGTLAPTPSAAAVPPLAFRDAEAAKRWVRELPLTNFVAAGRAVIDVLQALSRAELAPRDRAAIAEVMRDQVAYLHTELARRYAGRPQPAEGREQESADLAIALWQELWAQYSACLKPLLDDAPELAGVKPKLLQRGLYVGKQLVLAHGLAHRTPPAAVWHELHAYYRLAEMLECAVTAVSDNLIPNAIGISCYSTYAHALLLGLADPSAMSVKQIELADRWLAMWARKLFPYAQQRETEGPVIVVDLDSSAGAVLAPTPPRDASPAMRFGYPGKLATSVRGRLKRLQSGANPAELQLGHDCSAEPCTTLLGYLDAHWYQVPRHAAPRQSRDVGLCAGGFAAAYFRVGGRPFERQDAPGQMSFGDAQRMQALNVIASRDGGKAEAERTWAWEQWHGICEPREALVVRAGEAAAPLAARSTRRRAR